MNTNLSPSIQKMIQMAKDDPTFRSGLAACTTQEAAMVYLKTNGITVTSDELQSFATSHTTRGDTVNNNIGSCYVHF